MEKEPLLPDFPKGSADPFRVPDGYFEGLTERIMASLPEHPAEDKPTPTVSLMDKVKPLLYLAAAFLGMLLLFKGLSALRPSERNAAKTLYVQHATTPEALMAADEDSEYLDYLEAQYADLFLPDEIDEWD